MSTPNPTPATTDTAEAASASRGDRGRGLALAAVFVAALLTAWALHPEGVVVSRDPGYVPRPVPLLVVPALLAAAAALALPGPSRPASVITVRCPRRAVAETAGLIGLFALFVVLVPRLPLPEDAIVLKAALYMLVPALALGLLARRGASIEIERPAGATLPALLPVALLGVLPTLGPLATPAPSTWPPVGLLIVSAVATAITAGLGEELLFRRFLQTRLEALAGPWTGILATSLLFGLSHVLSHHGGLTLDGVAQVIAMQGSTGIALGLIWARWRRLRWCVLAHVLLNGLGVLVHLVSLAL